MPRQTRPKAAKPHAPRKQRITVEEVTDLTDQERSAHGNLYVAKAGDFTSQPRSTEARAVAECEAYLASLEQPDEAA